MEFPVEVVLPVRLRQEVLRVLLPEARLLTPQLGQLIQLPREPEQHEEPILPFCIVHEFACEVP